MIPGKITWYFPQKYLTFIFVFIVSHTAYAATTRYLQAEYTADLNHCGSGFQDSDHSGYTGSGFANCNNNSNAFIEWQFNSTRAGYQKIWLRFANGSGSPRSADFAINGTGHSITMNATGAWNSWSNIVLDVYLNQGSNTIRLRGTSNMGLGNVDRLDIEDTAADTDWGVAMAETTMLRIPHSETLGWEYFGALAVHGVFLVYERTRDPRYFAYIERWADGLVNSNGDLVNHSGSLVNLNNLDVLFASNVVLDYWQALDDPDKYSSNHRLRRAMQTVRNRFTENSNTVGTGNSWSGAYPRTSDGGFWHNLGAVGQLWLDGLFMSEKFLTRFGNQFGESAYTNNEATKQILVTHSHLKDNVTGLLWHAYDEHGNSWAAPGTLHSQEFWCRAMGWFSLISIDTLENLPATHPQYGNMRSTIQSFASGLANYQDPATGRWYQIINRQSDSRNWTETSCSSMFAYMMDKGIKLNILSSSFRSNADRAFNGVLQKVAFQYNSSLDATVLNIYDVTEGTGIGNANYYFNRSRPVNDKHGLGLFMMMAEQFRNPDGNINLDIGENGAGFCKADGVIENEHSGWGGSGYVNTDNTIGSGIEYKITLPASGNYKLRWRYANGTVNRSGRILIDGNANLSNVDFPGTGTWDSWRNARTQTFLAAGTHILRLESTNNSGLPNIDVFTINGNNPQESNCQGSSSSGSSSSGSTSSSGSSSSSSSSTSSTSGGSCAASQYVDGNIYATGDRVKNLGNQYECVVGGWCTVGGPYAPGVGWAWDNAWTLMGACI